MNEFKEYLLNKKIDWKSFEENEADRFSEFSVQFFQMHPDSFTSQKLYLINQIRRRYPVDFSITEETPKIKKQVKPKIIPRIKK